MSRRSAPKRKPKAGEVAVLEALRLELGRSFEEERDVGLLERLWSAAHGEGNETPFERTSERWAEFGFQGVDPVTDLRGGGVLGLQMLVTFLEESPFFARPIMASRRPTGGFDPNQPGFYPFACAGIQLTLALCELCGLCGAMGTPAPADFPELSCWHLLAESRASVDAVYGVGFRLLDRLFDAGGCGTRGGTPRGASLSRRTLGGVMRARWTRESDERAWSADLRSETRDD